MVVSGSSEYNFCVMHATCFGIPLSWATAPSSEVLGIKVTEFSYRSQITSLG
jgi:hypothetical protein